MTEEKFEEIKEDMTREHIFKKDEIVNDNFTLRHELIDGHSFYSCGYGGCKVFTNRSKRWVEELYSLLSDINMLY